MRDIIQQHPDLKSLQTQSTGEDSNSSDTMASDMGDQNELLNGSMDSRNSSFANSFLGIPGLLPGPSGMSDNFGEFRIFQFNSFKFRIQFTFFAVVCAVSIHFLFINKFNKSYFTCSESKKRKRKTKEMKIDTFFPISLGKTFECEDEKINLKFTWRNFHFDISARSA